MPAGHGPVFAGPAWKRPPDRAPLRGVARHGPVFAGPAWKPLQAERTDDAGVVTARYSPGQHGSTASPVGFNNLLIVTARYSPGQHGSLEDCRKQLAIIRRHGPVFAGPAWKLQPWREPQITVPQSRPGIRRASMEAGPTAAPTRSSSRHGPVFAGPAWKHARVRRKPDVPVRVTARYSPGQHGSMCHHMRCPCICIMSRPGIRRASMEAPSSAARRARRSRSHGPVFAGPAWKRDVAVEREEKWKGHGPVFAGPAWKPDGRVVLAPLTPVTARYSPGQHGSTCASLRPPAACAARVTARYSPGQHGSEQTRILLLRDGTSRPGIRRASMEAHVISYWTDAVPESRPGIRRASMEACAPATACTRSGPSRPGIRRASMEASPRTKLWGRRNLSRPGIRRASMEARRPLRTGSARLSRHGPVFAGPAWKLPQVRDGQQLHRRHGPVFAGPAWKQEAHLAVGHPAGGSRPGIRRASMEARQDRAASAVRALSRPGIRRASMEAGYPVS